MLYGLRARLRALLLRRRLEREMQEEMAGHLERSTARLVARGLSVDEARRQARREFGNVAVLQEQSRDARGARWVEAVAADARFALRHFARTPLTTLVMFVVLAVGIGIGTLLFSVVHSFATQPPPGIAREDDLVRIRGSRADAEGRLYRTFGEDEFQAYRALRSQFRAVAGWTRTQLPLVLPGDAERRPQDAAVFFVTENYFSVLGLRPVIGRGLPADTADAASSAAVAVIGHATWEHLFDRDPGVIGSTVTVGGVPLTIVGVAPERFYGISNAYARVQLWMPVEAQRRLFPDPWAQYRAVARLRPGVEPHSASAAVRVVAERLAASHDSLRAMDPSTDVVPLIAANSDPMFDRDVRLMSALVGLLGLLVLLVTCTNVSALLTGLATARRQEIAVRLSLGAARARLVRQLLTESVLLATAAGAAAIGLAALVVRVVSRMIPGIPFELAISWPATAFTLGVALGVGLLFGLSPALHGTRVALAGALRDSAGAVAGGRGRLQRALVVAQITFTQPLIALLATVLVLVVGTFQPGRQTELADRLIDVRLRRTISASAGSPAAAAAWAEVRVTMSALQERLRATPGVEATAVEYGTEHSLGAYAVHPDDRVPGGSQGVVRLVARRAAPGYLSTLGIPVVRGREFGPTEVAAAAPRPAGAGAIIGADLARRLWGGADPVGRRLRAASDSTPGARVLTVVGVIDDPMAGTRKAGEEVRVYLPPDTSEVAFGLLVRTAGEAAPLLPAVRAAVHQEAAAMPSTVRTFADIEDEIHRQRRMAASGISVVGLMALGLSAIGLYAVVAFAVGQRTREIAVRMAIGAPTGRIVGRFVADGVRLGVIGLLLGLPASLLGLRFLLAADAEFPALPLGPVTLIAAAGVLAVATTAAWIPARRAAAVDPAVTLRSQ